MSFWSTNMCSDFLDVQGTNSRLSQRCRIRHNFIGRRFENESIPALRLWECVPKRQASFSFSSCSSFSFHAIDLVLSNIPESSCPARHCIFEKSEAVIRMIMNGRSPKLSVSHVKPFCGFS